jgi:hypothetical protein
MRLSTYHYLARKLGYSNARPVIDAVAALKLTPAVQVDERGGLLDEAQQRRIAKHLNKQNTSVSVAGKGGTTS